MPTDTTIPRWKLLHIDQWEAPDGEWVRYEEHERALTAAHAARDAAKAEAREHEIAKYRAEERANEAIDLLKTRTELAEVAKTGENWPCNARAGSGTAPPSTPITTLAAPSWRNLRSMSGTRHAPSSPPPSGSATRRGRPCSR